MREPAELAAMLVRQTMALSEGPVGRYRVEDLLSAGAAFTGECVLRWAGDFDADRHTFAPGQAVFSDSVNGRLLGEKLDWEQMPSISVFGEIYRALRAHGFSAAAFPNVTALMRLHASVGQGNEPSWGYVQLGVSPDHMPRQHPIRRAFELRTWAEENAPELLSDATLGLTVAQFALIKLLIDTHDAIEEPVALAIVFGTINGMAKMAPFLARHMAASQGR